MNSSANPPATTSVNSPISSFTGGSNDNNGNGSSLSSALAETVANLACFGSSMRPQQSLDNGNNNNCGPRILSDVSTGTPCTMRGSDSTTGSVNNFGANINNGPVKTMPQAFQQQQQVQTSHLLNSMKQQQERKMNVNQIANNSTGVLKEISGPPKEGGMTRKPDSVRFLQPCAVPCPLSNVTIPNQPSSELKPAPSKLTPQKSTLTFIHHPSDKATPRKGENIINNHAPETTCKDSLSNTIASLATLSNFATPNKKPSPSSKPATAPLSHSPVNQRRHSRSLSGPIISGTAFSAVVAMQNRGINDSSPPSGKKCKTPKKEGKPNEIKGFTPKSTSTTKTREESNPTAALEQIALVSNSITKSKESKKRPAQYKTTPNKFQKRCSDGAPIIAGTAAAAMAIATAARIATNNDAQTKTMHGFGIQDDTLDRMVTLSTKAVLGLGENNCGRKSERTPKFNREYVSKVTPEEEQHKDETSSLYTGYRIASATQPAHHATQPLLHTTHSAPSSVAFSSQPASFLKSSQLNSNSSSAGGRCLGGMDILADIICHVPPMAIPEKSSTSTGGVNSHSYNSFHPPQHHYESSQETGHDQQINQRNNVPAIPSYQEIYQEMGIAPRNPATTESNYKTNALSDCNSHRKPQSLPYPTPRQCFVETISNPRDSNDDTTQSHSRRIAIHYGHPLGGEIEEGKELYTRKDLVVMGGHLLENKDVHGSMKEGADSVVLCNLERDLREADGLCWFLYSCDRTNGGGALCRSYHKKRAIRVFRSAILTGRFASPYLDDDEEDDEISYRYDGLYMVRAVWDIHGNETESFPCAGEEGWQTYFFVRLPKKPLDGKTEPGMKYNAMGLQELWSCIQKMKGVKRPKKFEIPHAPLKLPPMKRCAISGDNKDRKATSYRPPEVPLKEDAEEPSESVEKAVSTKKAREEKPADSSDDEAPMKPPPPIKQPESLTSHRNERSPKIVPRPIPNKVVTPRPRMSSTHQDLKKTLSPSLNCQKRVAPTETSDSSDSEPEVPVPSKKVKVETPKNTSLSPPKRQNNLAQVLSTLLPKRATAAKAEAANRNMFGAKKKRPYNRKSTQAPTPAPRKSTRRSKTDEESSSSSIDGIDPDVLTVGSRVLVLYKGALFKATIRKRRQKNGKHDFQIHYDGNKKSNVHWIPVERIQKILSIAIDTISATKAASSTKGKRGGWNKKKPEPDAQHSDHSDNESADGTKSRDAKCKNLKVVSKSVPAEMPEEMEEVNVSEEITNSETAKSGDPKPEEMPAKTTEGETKDETDSTKLSPETSSILEKPDSQSPHESNPVETALEPSKSTETESKDDVDSTKLLPGETEVGSCLAESEEKLETASAQEKQDDDMPVNVDAKACYSLDKSKGTVDPVEPSTDTISTDAKTLCEYPVNEESEVCSSAAKTNTAIASVESLHKTTSVQEKSSNQSLLNDENPCPSVDDDDLKEVPLANVSEIIKLGSAGSNATASSNNSKRSRITVFDDVEAAPQPNKTMDGATKTLNRSSTLSSNDAVDVPSLDANATSDKEEDDEHENSSDHEQSGEQEAGDPTSELKFPVGTHVYVEYRRIFYSSTILQTRRKRKVTEYLVHYEGFKKASDRWVKEGSLHYVNAETTRRFEEQRLASPNIVPEPGLSFPSDSSMTTRGKSINADDHVHHHFTRQKKPPTRSKSDASDIAQLGDIESGVAFLPGSVVFVQLNDALYLAKMVKKRFAGERTEYLVSFDGYDSDHDAWNSIHNIYEVNPQTKRVFNKLNAEIKSGMKPKKQDPPKRSSVKKKRESSSTRSSSTIQTEASAKKQKPEVLFSSPPLPRRRGTRKTQDEDNTSKSEYDKISNQSSTTAARPESPPIDSQGIPPGVDFLPGSTLFAQRKGCLCVAKMLKRRGKGDFMEYFIQFNDGTEDSESKWISTALVYEINPQTKRLSRQLLSKKG